MQKTPTINNDLNPVWKTGNEFTYTLHEEDEYLDIEVFNSNYTIDETLGRLRLSLVRPPCGEVLRFREALEDGNIGEIEFQAGLDAPGIPWLRREVVRPSQVLAGGALPQDDAQSRMSAVSKPVDASSRSRKSQSHGHGYDVQLNQLAEMGFTDKAACLSALHNADGDFERAVQLLVNT